MLLIHILYLTSILAITVKSNKCVINNEIKNRNNTSDYFDEDFDDSYLPTRRFLLKIFPGTKWCGPGNIAYNYDDLGLMFRTDACCRKHDNCDEVILPGESKYGLRNNAQYSRLSCKCDEEFRDCLNNIGSLTATAVGKGYFNYLGVRCFRRTSGNVYKWFDGPKYRPLGLLTGNMELPVLRIIFK